MCAAQPSRALGVARVYVHSACFATHVAGVWLNMRLNAMLFATTRMVLAIATLPRVAMTMVTRCRPGAAQGMRYTDWSTLYPHMVYKWSAIGQSRIIWNQLLDCFENLTGAWPCSTERLVVLCMDRTSCRRTFFVVMIAMATARMVTIVVPMAMMQVLVTSCWPDVNQANTRSQVVYRLKEYWSMLGLLCAYTATQRKNSLGIGVKFRRTNLHGVAGRSSRKVHGVFPRHKLQANIAHFEECGGDGDDGDGGYDDADHVWTRRRLVVDHVWTSCRLGGRPGDLPIGLGFVYTGSTPGARFVNCRSLKDRQPWRICLCCA